MSKGMFLFCSQIGYQIFGQLIIRVGKIADFGLK